LTGSYTEHPVETALVIGASGGIGGAIAQRLRTQGCAVDGLSRSNDGVDLCNEESLARPARAMAATGKEFDLVFVASGILDVPVEDKTVGPEKSLRDLSPAAAMKAFEVNALGPALAFKHFAPLLRRQSRAVFAALSARVGSIGDNRLGGWMSYRASKAALNQFIRCAAIEHQRKNADHIVVALHPGTIPSQLTQTYARGRYTASPDEAAHNLLSVLSGLSPEQNGHFFDYAGKTVPW